MKIAIIGSGISGLGAAYLLNPDHDITVYEKNDYIGGHSRTITASTQTGSTPTDTGFIVFNKKNYPHLTALFELINAPIVKSDMSFGVSIKNAWLEYGSKSIFAQKKNFFRPQFWQMIFNILKFNQNAKKYLEKKPNASLEQCLDDMKFGKWFREYYLQAMGAAIWSCSAETILKFPAQSFINFFENHGLLTINNHPQWYSVDGGSKEYVSRLTESFLHKIKLNTPIHSVSKLDNKKLEITTQDKQSEQFDAVIFACHADEALKINKVHANHAQKLLESFQYQDNQIIVHTDDSFMPHNRDAWASWVYLSDNNDNDNNKSVSLTYWMNNLQNLQTSQNIFVTLNPGRMPDASKIIDTHTFSHPVFDKDAVAAQKQLNTIQGQDGIYYCGAYQRYGFHEDGLLSAVRVAKTLGTKIPWE